MESFFQVLLYVCLVAYLIAFTALVIAFARSVWKDYP